MNIHMHDIPLLSLKTQNQQNRSSWKNQNLQILHSLAADDLFDTMNQDISSHYADHVFPK